MCFLNLRSTVTACVPTSPESPISITGIRGLKDSVPWPPTAETEFYINIVVILSCWKVSIIRGKLISFYSSIVSRDLAHPHHAGSRLELVVLLETATTCVHERNILPCPWKNDRSRFLSSIRFK
ncbi:hypothetical protein PUN28_016350 [Cardiocondyla obscurior]|uniref:Uncharacterized protein n=1 Tax=Cardiocondyla obscurior TaxID=286306 RepID=A0AAW2EVS5_9HYME